MEKSQRNKRNDIVTSCLVTTFIIISFCLFYRQENCPCFVRQCTNTLYKCSSFCHLGIAHVKQDKYKEALDYYNQALQMRQHLYKGDHSGIADVLFNIGKMSRGNN